MACRLEIKARVVVYDSNSYHLLNTCLVLGRHNVKYFTYRALIATLQIQYYTLHLMEEEPEIREMK